MEPQDYPIAHFDQMLRIAKALKRLPAQVLEHAYYYESFGSWRLVVRYRGLAFRMLFDGKEHVLTAERSPSRKAPYSWDTVVWRKVGVHDAKDDDIISAIVQAAG
jgi:hypothetical protein